MKDARLFVFVCLVTITLVFFISPYIMKSQGVIVTSVDSNSACGDIIMTDSIITEIAGVPIKNTNDFTRVTKNLKGPVTFIINGNPRSCTIPENSSLSITIRNIKTGGLKFSVDIGGGTYFLFKPKKELPQDVLGNILNTIRFRSNSYNLINTIISIQNDSIKIVSGPEEEEYIKLLTEQGILEGDVIQKIDFTNKRGEFTLNESTYEVLLKKDNSIVINGTEYKENENLELNDLNIRVGNISSNATLLFVKIFDDEDLLLSNGDVSKIGSSRIAKQDSGYVFVLPVMLSSEASKNFARATAGQEIVINPTTGEGFLKFPLTILIDDKPFINLPLRSVDTGKIIGELILWGYKQTAEEASNDLLRLKNIIKFKSLPEELGLIETGDFHPSVGEFYLSLFLYGTLITILVILILFFVRHRKNGVLILPLILLCLGEIVLVSGTIIIPWFILLIFFSGIFFVILRGEIKGLIGWVALFLMFMMVVGIAMTKFVLGYYSVIGMTAVLSSSLILEAIIADKVLNKTDLPLTSELKRFLEKFWWFATIATMFLLPLFFLVDILRGFFATIFVGILTISILITPIYFKIIEKMGKKT